jgi:type I restriction enzyme R subunit
MSSYNVISSTNESTVVAQYVGENNNSNSYQSERDLELEFIGLLRGQGYDLLKIHNEADLVANLRTQLEQLNHYTFSDEEWNRFFAECIANGTEGIVEKSRKIQTDHVQILRRDNGDTKNIYLFDKKNIHNNCLQVINQYEETEGTRKTRYDVTILVNGLPLVHIELKRRGVAIREAFNQIKRYQRDSFWAGSGLFEYVQIFVISNGTHTKYYSNTTRFSHVKEIAEGERKKSKKTSNSFEFTSYWADGNNKPITDLIDFTRTFFARHTILAILARYCVFTSENLLMVMRPYQIAATERILSRIENSHNREKVGTIEAGGYIWHTTGSGKTLTSFKTAQLACGLPYIDKVLFVVDRKDLDYQTMKEYDRFQKGAANSNASTRILAGQLQRSDARIIITTIQKLDRFVSMNKSHEIYKKHVVIIFDECHRSQFGDMHIQIVKSFKNYHLFGFTGTPIFAANAGSSGNPLMRTTEQAFGDKLHTYTIVDAINDGNVLPFRIDYIDTVRMRDGVVDINVHAIDTERAMADEGRIREVVRYILEHFDQKTKRNSFYSLEGQRVSGFNSILAVSSIPVAKMYYKILKEQLAESGRELKVATIFSYNANEADPEDLLPDENFDTARLDKSSRDFLEEAIADYNALFGTNFDTSADKFQSYYKDLSMRMKKREVDLLVVVNMFLTGFDATTLNTLWVDKNLRLHGLIQAFSRTNRILNSVKTFGNIVCFRNLEEATDKAIALFGNREAGGIVLLKSYQDYYAGYDEKGKHHPGYIELIEKLRTDFPPGVQIVGEDSQKDFIRLFGAILRLRNILTAFDDFEGNKIPTERDFQDYQSRYIDLHQSFTKEQNAEKEKINDDLVFEMELIKQIEVNIDYILRLVERYRKSNSKDRREIRVNIAKAVDSSIRLRSKKELIEGFVDRMTVSGNVEEDWKQFVSEQKEKELNSLIETEKLKPEKTQKFVENALRDGILRTTGTDIDGILPPISRFTITGERARIKDGVINKLLVFFEKYFGAA